MRRLARGSLATLLLVLAGCGGNGSDGPADAARDVTADDGSSELAASHDAAAADGGAVVPPDAGSLTIVVTSPEGVDAAGLDAAATVLVGRPDTNVRVIATAADVTGVLQGRSTTTLVPVEAETMSGMPATAVNGSALDTVDAILAAGPVDLVVVGLTGDEADDPSSAASVTATAVRDAGVPALVVATGEDGPDLAGAAMMLSTVVDYELDLLLAGASVHTLTVPTCATGLLQGPVVVEPAVEPAPSAPVDCALGADGPFGDESEALSNGFAALTVAG